MIRASRKAERLTGWVSIIGALFAFANVALVVMLTGSDQDMVLNGSAMLTLSSDERLLFRLSMAADILGFYLPFLAIGGYIWHIFKDEASALGDMAVLAITLYVAVGIAGASMDLAILEPLARTYAGGGDAVRAGSSAAWSAIANAVQSGLWWIEGPLVLFWVLVIGGHLKRARFGTPILASVIGYTFGLLTLTGFFPSMEDITNFCELVVVLLVPVWMIILGVQLLRQSD